MKCCISCASSFSISPLSKWLQKQAWTCDTSCLINSATQFLLIDCISNVYFLIALLRQPQRISTSLILFCKPKVQNTYLESRGSEHLCYECGELKARFYHVQEVLQQEEIDVGLLRNLAKNGIPDKHSIRAMAWKVMLDLTRGP